jgi:hypothetical protein
MNDRAGYICGNYHERASQAKTTPMSVRLKIVRSRWLAALFAALRSESRQPQTGNFVQEKCGLRLDQVDPVAHQVSIDKDFTGRRGAKR